jgi:hypothetical protein
MFANDGAGGGGGGGCSIYEYQINHSGYSFKRYISCVTWKWLNQSVNAAQH